MRVTLVALIFFVQKKATQFPESLFLVGAEGVEPPTMASHRLSFYPQSLRDSPGGHADAVFDAIGHLRPPGCARNNKKTPHFRVTASSVGRPILRMKCSKTQIRLENQPFPGRICVFVC